MAGESAYAGLAPDGRGHSSWFLARTNKEHQATMDHPFMKSIYARTFDTDAYVAYLRAQLSIFSELERLCALQRAAAPLAAVHDEALHRADALRADLGFWAGHARGAPAPAAAEARYLERLRQDSADPWLLLCHHFLNYNAVLSGGQFLGSMVSSRAGVDPPVGVEFFRFPPSCEPVHDRVLQYLGSMDGLQIPEQRRGPMLECMRAVYALHLQLFDELHALAAPGPAAAAARAAAGEDGGARRGPIPPPLDPAERDIALGELRRHGGTEGATLGLPLLTSVLGRVYDVSAARGLFGVGGPYSMFVGHDGTYNLAVMSLKQGTLDRFAYEVDDEERQCLADWIAYFDNKFGRPVGRLSDKTHSLELRHLPPATRIPFQEEEEEGAGEHAAGAAAPAGAPASRL